MKKYRASTYVILTLLFLTSCSISRSNIAKNYSINDKNGVIFFSLTASGRCNFNYFIDIRNINTKESQSIGLTDSSGSLDWKKHSKECPSGKDNYDGRLIAIDLPEGVYDIYDLSGINLRMQTTSEKDIVMRFQVKKNEIKYLGNVHFHINKKSFTYGVKDSRDRDVLFFKRKYKNLRNKDIKISIIRIQNRKHINNGPAMAA